MVFKLPSLPFLKYAPVFIPECGRYLPALQRESLANIFLIHTWHISTTLQGVQESSKLTLYYTSLQNLVSLGAGMGKFVLT